MGWKLRERGRVAARSAGVRVAGALSLLLVSSLLYGVFSAHVTGALTSEAWAQGPKVAEPVPPPAPAEPADADHDAIVLNFEGADIREVIHSLAGALGINYLIDPRVEEGACVPDLPCTLVVWLGDWEGQVRIRGRRGVRAARGVAAR